MFSLTENTDLEKIHSGKRVFDFFHNGHHGRLFFHKETFSGAAVTDLPTIHSNVRMALDKIQTELNSEEMAGKPLLAKTTYFSQRIADLLSNVAGLKFDAYSAIH